MLVDSHCHLDRIDLTDFNNDLNEAISYAKTLEVEYFLNVCVDLETFPQVLAIAKKYNRVSASVGLHPTELVAKEPSVDELIMLAQDDKVVAIGETGLDYYRLEDEGDWQRERFRRHIQAAKATQKPLIIHTRQAREDTIKIMHEENAETVGGVMHCFTEDWDMAKKAIDLGFYISFSGIVTFKNALELKEVAKHVPLDRMLVETDAPYLAPVPYRGKPNQPAYVRYVAEYLAELKDIPFATIAKQTTENFFRLFRHVQR